MTESSRETLLVELGCEELPPKSLDLLATAFFEGVCARLEKEGIEFDPENSRPLFSPRRLALQISAVAGRQPDRELERRGPAVQVAYDADGNPTAAAEGFARSVGADVTELETLKTDKGEWIFCRVHEPGRKLEELLFTILQQSLDALPVAKPMRWADHSYSFVRPVHWLVVLHGDRILPGELFGHAAGGNSRGHRIHHPEPVLIDHAANYLEALEHARVLADPEVRRHRIRTSVAAAGKEIGGFARITDALLDEVNNLVEWPVAVSCSFDADFLDVPQEALIASMEDHQKFFPVLTDRNGRLRREFVAVANLESRDFNSVKQGYERVIRPRLADAQFFWDQDRKQPLEDSRPALERIVFQKKIGTVGDKSSRLVDVSANLAGILGEDKVTVQRAAHLCKCDLVSHMVGEFPELQGTMGAYYAKESGESGPVSTAIGEHYFPRFSGDRLPESVPGQLLALADRIDTLVGIFAAGLKPSGNRDPFALRRAALGAVRLLTESGLNLELDRILAIGANAFSTSIDVRPDTLNEVRSFIIDRARQYFRDQGVDTRLVDAALASPLSTLLDLKKRIQALDQFMTLAAGESLVAANKRIGNILRKAEEDVGDTIDEDRLILIEERQLFGEVSALEKDLPILFEAGRYDSALKELAGLHGAVDRFFDSVMVMDENESIRLNRLCLLKRLKSLFDRVADLSLAG